jgi:hypothetical protein
MNKIYPLLFLVLISFSACKSKKVLAETAANSLLSADKIIQAHYANELNFETVNIRSSVKYRDAKQSYSVSADIRIKKDEYIWLNIKLLGFPIAKALITPTKVSFYEKINNTYFEGDFAFLSKFVGTDLDFEKAQNLFIGQAIDDLSKEKYTSLIQNELYVLTPKNESAFEKQFSFEATNFLLTNEIIGQPSQNRNLKVSYATHSFLNGMYFPNSLGIIAVQKDTITIDLDYKNIDFNEELSVPFAIPEGYTKIEIK